MVVSTTQSVFAAIYHIEDFYHASDKDDWLPAVKRAQHDWHASAATDDYHGFTLHFGPRTYKFSGPIELIRTMSLVGSGGAGWYAGTIIQFPAGVHGIICHTETTAPAATPGRGYWSIVERVHIAGTSSTSLAHGVVVHARMALRDCYISDFTGDGIHIDADHRYNTPTNANLWQIQNCRVDRCNNGFFVQGKDANAGCAIALDCSSNKGYGIYDNSFLGNTYVACHTADNKGGGYKCTEFNDPVTGTKTASIRSLFLNCYSEQKNQPPPQINAPSVVLGRMSMDVVGTAIWLNQSDFIATFQNGARGLSRRTSGTSSTAAAYLGSPNLNGVALELHYFKPNEDPNKEFNPYRFHYERWHRGWWELVYANAAVTPLRFSTNEATEGQGHLWMENGYFIGRNPSRVQIQTGSSPPTSGTRKKGDRILNSDPAGGEYAGWICTVSGSPGTWKGFGLIEQ